MKEDEVDQTEAPPEAKRLLTDEARAISELRTKVQSATDWANGPGKELIALQVV